MPTPPDPRLRRVALTGGIATGKTYCLSRFRELGAATIDADVLAHEAVAPGRPMLAAIVRRFGRGLLDANGQLDRAALGRLVFADEAARRDLEALVHPAVYQAIEQWFQGLPRPADAGPTTAIADIPLLFETGHEGEFDVVIVVACGPDLQRARLVARSGLTEAEARQRMASQMPLDEKVRHADYVIDTSGTLEETDEQVRSVWAALTR
jgi:dephospho-CoA kinase